MKKHYFFTTLLSILMTSLFSQQTIDLAFQFPNGGTFRKYHIYVPSAYSASKPNKLMVGFHPFDKARWNGKSWRDSLISFAENKDLLLVCPDGGVDGRIDDQVDYDFTTALIDSMKQWYNIDPLQVFGLGFSLGGKAMYEYGLTNSKTFKGFIPMGAAITDPSFVDDVIVKARCKNYYIIHGDQDSPNVRYYPIKTDLEKNKAKVNTILMAGIGNTFDFPNRLSIMMRAFNYIDTASCNYTGIEDQEVKAALFFPNPIQLGQKTEVSWPGHREIEAITHEITGKEINRKKHKDARCVFQMETDFLTPGLYIITLQDGGNVISGKLMVIP